jgi:hypothetical protein
MKANPKQELFTLPEAKSEFVDNAEKGTYIQAVMETSQKAITAADNSFNQLLYPEAQTNYLVSLEGYMSLLKITADDPNFQTYLKQQMKYIFVKVSPTSFN